MSSDESVARNNTDVESNNSESDASVLDYLYVLVSSVDKVTKYIHVISSYIYK